jgi:hypothetical protein
MCQPRRGRGRAVCGAWPPELCAKQHGTCAGSCRNVAARLIRRRLRPAADRGLLFVGRQWQTRSVATASCRVAAPHHVELVAGNGRLWRPHLSRRHLAAVASRRGRDDCGREWQRMADFGWPSPRQRHLAAVASRWSLGQTVAENGTDEPLSPYAAVRQRLWDKTNSSFLTKVDARRRHLLCGLPALLSLYWPYRPLSMMTAVSCSSAFSSA